MGAGRPSLRLLTVGSLPPEWGGAVRGGVATFHATLLEGLLEAASEVELVGVVPPAPLDREPPVPVFERPADVGRAAFYEALLQEVRPDVVLMNHVAHTIGVAHAALPAPPPAVGVIHSWHNITFAEPSEGERSREVTQEALGGLTALVAPSRHCLEEGRRLGVRYPPVAEVVPYPLQSLYHADVDVEGGDRRGVIFVGGLTPRKNPEALVEAAALLPLLEIAFVGEGELEPALRGSIARRSLGDRVRLAALGPGADHSRGIRDLLLGAEVLCLPSHSESFGLVFIEALACGTPVVGFGPTVREIQAEMGIEVGEPLDDPASGRVAAAIERVRSREWDRGELRQATIDAFGLPRITRRYVELLSRVCG